MPVRGRVATRGALLAEPLRRALAPLPVLLALVGCAGGPAGAVRVAPTIVPPERIAATVAIALREWQRWGELDVLVLPEQQACALLADGSCSEVDDGCGREASAAWCPLVDDYWRPLREAGRTAEHHRCDVVDRCEAHWIDAEPAPYTPPWSAAFISAVLREAGYGDTEFRFAAAHADYVVAARDGYASAFEVLPTPLVPRVGDLVCATRPPAPSLPLPVERIRPTPLGTAMHCDLVVQVDASAHRLQAIGGNVQQAVARSIVALDEQNRLVPWLNAQRPWVLAMRPRTAAQ